jgi:glyceraldehyde-3-phosphate dehydrogenase (NAD(P))
MRVGVVGLGVIGKRAVEAIAAAPEMTLAGVAVRTVPAAAYCMPNLTYHSPIRGTRAELGRIGVPVGGSLDDLLRVIDVVVDAGTARTGAARADMYRAAGVRAVFCGGERDVSLGPLVHSALNHAVAARAQAVRVASCNTTALARMVARLGVSSVRRLEAVVLRCSTDNDKARKGRTNGALVEAGSSHHAADLRALVPGLNAVSQAVVVPMTCGHVIHLRLVADLSMPDALRRLGNEPRLRLVNDNQAVDTARVRADAARRGGRWSQRFDLVVRAGTAQPDGNQPLRFWLSLDNESITMPELLDVLLGWAAPGNAEQVRTRTDAVLGLSVGPRARQQREA